MIEIHQCDCLELLNKLEDNSIDLIATDPPYYKVKSDDWDNQWKNRAEYLQWMNQVFEEYQRVLKPTGSLYVFANPYLGSHIELEIEQHFNVLNHLVWRKPSGRFKGANKESLRKYFPQTERIIFAESNKAKTFHYEPILSYLKSGIKRSNLKPADIHRLTGTHMYSHWFGRSQFSLLSESHYQTLQRNAPNLSKPYHKLRAEYLALKHNRGRRPFNMNRNKAYTDVWDFNVVNSYKGKHPCEKPADLMEHIISTSSNKGDIVLDTFLGSGATLKAAHKLDRQFIGCEFGNDEFNTTVNRLLQEGVQPVITRKPLSQ
jgi:site-specific DNA-methyltransferase (adenine-specific)